eukprot:TRINITY_DN6568_c0_g1_i2.p1 TRINITY_DN6568_c0_g1~~TRINITY_DN6568_c0_g1_i2.p1  ORF type:complete len:253 (+),score=35.28 TRINITY_DN6568_c0_g1_i2:67-825(+)
MQFHLKPTELQVDGAPVKVHIPTLEMDEATKKEVAKAGAFFALTGVTGALAVGGAAALDEWHAMAQGPMQPPTTPRSRRCRVRRVSGKDKPQTPEEKRTARMLRRARETELIAQMRNDSVSGSGVEPRGRYQPSYSPAESPSSELTRAQSVDSLRGLAQLHLGDGELDTPPSPMAVVPRQERMLRERLLMQQMTDLKREYHTLDASSENPPPCASPRVVPRPRAIPRPRNRHAENGCPGEGRMEMRVRRTSF